MLAVKSLPEGYVHQGTLDLSSTRDALWLNLAAVPLLFVFGWFFNYCFKLVSLRLPTQITTWQVIRTFSFGEWMLAILCLLLMLIAHELVHGMFFWGFTHEKPHYALRSGYAFAAAPDWYLAKYAYLLVGLSPLIIISVFCLILAAFAGPVWRAYLLLIATFNAAGALGDMIVVGWVLRHGRKVYVRDEGDKFSIYGLAGE